MVDAARLHREAVVVDAHAHPPDFVPQPARSLYRLVNRTTMPPDLGFGDLDGSGVDALVAKAVGDPIVTRWYRGTPWNAVLAQLGRIRAGAAAAGAVVARDAADVRGAHKRGALAILLGLEGGDAIGGEVGRVDELAAIGVRVVVPVHLADNQLGSTCLPWQRYVGPLPVRRRVAVGLSPLGRRVVERMNEVGIVVDVSHADERTTLDILAASRRPVIASHAGARAVDGFARYLTDDELRAIAATGGVVGLWPYNHRGRGVPTLGALVAHARHVAELVGPEHLCLGTDMNGVPGVMDGYRDERDLPRLTDALLADGFGADDARGILGENVLRVLDAVSAG